MNKLISLEDLLQYQMQIIFDAENQLIQSLPVLEEAASRVELKKIFSQHLEETKMHKERMTGMAHDLNILLKGKTCEVMQRLIKQINKFCDLNVPLNIKDAALITYAQRIENYEIASYGNIIRYAQALGYDYLTNSLQQNMIEESNAHKILYNLSIDSFYNQTRNYSTLYH